MPQGTARGQLTTHQLRTRLAPLWPEQYVTEVYKYTTVYFYLDPLYDSNPMSEALLRRASRIPIHPQAES